MNKIIGFIIITTLCFFIGHDYSTKLWQKHREILRLKSAMELLSCEIQARNQLIRSLSKIAKLQKGKTKDFFTALIFKLNHEPQKGIVDSWEECAKFCFEDILSDSQLMIFCTISAVLATGEEPKNGFRVCIDNLEKFAEEAENSARRDGKMFTGLGLSSGIMLSIILM